MIQQPSSDLNQSWYTWKNSSGETVDACAPIRIDGISSNDAGADWLTHTGQEDTDDTDAQFIDPVKVWINGTTPVADGSYGVCTRALSLPTLCSVDGSSSDPKTPWGLPNDGSYSLIAGGEGFVVLDDLTDDGEQIARVIAISDHASLFFALNDPLTLGGNATTALLVDASGEVIPDSGGGNITLTVEDYWGRFSKPETSNADGGNGGSDYGSFGLADVVAVPDGSGNLTTSYWIRELECPPSIIYGEVSEDGTEMDVSNSSDDGDASLFWDMSSVPVSNDAGFGVTSSGGDDPKKKAFANWEDGEYQIISVVPAGGRPLRIFGTLSMDGTSLSITWCSADGTLTGSVPVANTAGFNVLTSEDHSPQTAFATNTASGYELDNVSC